MSGTNKVQPDGSGKFKQYVNGGSDSTTWASVPADYAQIVGAGSTVLTCEDSTTAAVTTDAAEPVVVLKGPFLGLVSTTATRVRMGYGAPPVAVPAPATVGGTLATWATGATTTAFSAAIDTLYYLTVTSAVVAQLPALSNANEGHRVAFFNNATSAAVVTPTGSDLLATSGGAGATAATAAGPTGGNMQTWVAMTALGKWVKWA